MDLSTGILLGIVGVMGLNQAIMRVDRLAEDDRVYLVVQLIDALAAGLILWFGLPGFEAFPAVHIVVALLFVFHMAQNYNARARRVAEERAEEREAVEEEARRLRESRAPDEDF